MSFYTCKKMALQAYSIKTVATGIILSILVVSSLGNEDSCHSFADGQVYPQETKRTSGHTIQWSQASIFLIKLIDTENTIPTEMDESSTQNTTTDELHVEMVYAAPEYMCEKNLKKCVEPLSPKIRQHSTTRKRNTTNRKNKISQELDEFDALGMIIVSKLRKIDSRSEMQRWLCENIINQALFKGLMNRLTDNSTLSDSDIAQKEGVVHSPQMMLPSSNLITSDQHARHLEIQEPQISKPAPDWNGTAVIKGEFKDIKLSDFKGKYLVFFFYPLDFTFVCPTEIIAFSDSMEQFRKINTEIVGCSVDSQFTHLAWTNVPRNQGGLGKINFPLLSDITHEISKAYGVYLQDLGHSLRGLFIIDPKGTLRQITMNDLPVGRSVDETLRLVQAFQYTDKHGEVCPAGWKPGSDTIIPDPKKSKEYFKKHTTTDEL